MSLFEQINNGIKEAMKNRDQLRLEVLRMLKSKVLAVDARGNLLDAEILKIFKTYFGSLQEALQEAIAANRKDISDKLKAELEIIQEFLPKPPSLEETKKLISQAMQETGAKTKKDLGLVMKAVMKLNSDVDGKLTSKLVAELLQD
ncbi:MAG: hypothetical protein FJZ59_04100 [Chlamydiae bacterium]|jgi:uncharacterized protein YqeY|nr:hypothetical protein [Chlamydiota bacterium]